MKNKPEKDDQGVYCEQCKGLVSQVYEFTGRNWCGRCLVDLCDSLNTQVAKKDERIEALLRLVERTMLE